MIEKPKKLQDFKEWPGDSAEFLAKLFEVKELWERRFDRAVPYRNGEWFTLGTPLYLDLLAPEGWDGYKAKCEYFNEVLNDNFSKLLSQVSGCFPFPNRAAFLSDHYPYVSLPGFHIFPGYKTFGMFFGKPHQDLQWGVLPKLPDFPFKETEMRDHFSFTYVLKVPHLGASLLLYDGIDTEEFEYEEGVLYIHSGQQKHAIAPFKTPVLPIDYRITMQGHGFTTNGQTYLYW